MKHTQGKIEVFKDESNDGFDRLAGIGSDSESYVLAHVFTDRPEFEANAERLAKDKGHFDVARSIRVEHTHLFNFLKRAKGG